MAPSGTGKSTLVAKLKADFPQIRESVSWTTRPRRKGEVNGAHYFFISKEEFEGKLQAGDFLEWAQVHAHYYGTAKESILKGLEKGESLLFDLDIQGCEAIKSAFPEAKVIFVEPPSLGELEKRLRGRKTETENGIRLRLENAKKELAHKSNFDYLVLNDHLDRAYGKLKEVVQEILGRGLEERGCSN